MKLFKILVQYCVVQQRSTWSGAGGEGGVSHSLKNFRRLGRSTGSGGGREKGVRSRYISVYVNKDALRISRMRVACKKACATEKRSCGRENSVTSERMVGEAPGMRFSLNRYTALYRALNVLVF